MSPELSFSIVAVVLSACKFGAIYWGDIKKASTIDPLPWLLWAGLSFVTLGFQIVEMKWQWALLFTGANIAINVGVLWIVWGNERGTFSRGDKSIIAVAVLGIVFWIWFHDASFGLIFCLIADAIGAVRMWWKSWRGPYEELARTWIFGSLAAVAGFVAAKYSPNSTAMWYPGYVIVGASGTALIIIGRRAYFGFCARMTSRSLARA